jgi:hypothetical protein
MNGSLARRDSYSRQNPQPAFNVWGNGPSSQNNLSQINRQGEDKNSQSQLELDNAAMNAKLERELAALRQTFVQKDNELKQLKNLDNPAMGAGSNELLYQCVQSYKKLRMQEAELKDLRLNYNLLKEETEKQKHDLAKFEAGDDFERIPRNKEDLIQQNQILKQKISQIQQEYEKTLYDKTLEIEMKARGKMYKIAIDIAKKHLDPQDVEMQNLIASITELEEEKRRLENNAAEASFAY